MKTTIKSLDEYLKMNEDFYNPFIDDEEFKGKKEHGHITDHGNYLEKRKQTFNLSKIEWSKKGSGTFAASAKSHFAKGDIIEICPVIIVPSICKTIDTLREMVFEIDKNKDEFGLVLGYGSLYAHNERANVEYAYNRGQRLMYFLARTHIKAHEELTINYGTDYWAERDNLNTIKNIESITKTPELEESEIQPGAVDIQQKNTISQYSAPNSRTNPVVSGVSIMGAGQS